MQKSAALGLPPPTAVSWLGGRDVNTHYHLTGGAPVRTAAASTGFESAYWMNMKTKWSNSLPHPTQSFSGLRGAAGK